MKNYKRLAFLALTIAFAACNKEEKKNISINLENLKQTYTLNEDLVLQLDSASATDVDSVQYFLNDVKIGSVKQNDAFTYTLDKAKHGQQLVKAVAFGKGSSNETTISFEILSRVQPAIYTYTIVNTYPHDLKAYTQGLEFYGDLLIESTGNGEGLGTRTKGKSSIRKVHPATGEVIKINELDDAIFGEGATVLNNKIYQLTYLHNEGYVYNIETLEREKTLPYFKQMEGWGLTNDGTHLYMTDGTDHLYKIDPETFKLIDYAVVSTNRGTIRGVNELEWVDGEIFANFYGQDAIGIFNPEDGTVNGVVDLSDLKSKVTPHPDLDVLNGIAYNKKTGTFFVTGKNWDKMFEIKINR